MRQPGPRPGRRPGPGAATGDPDPPSPSRAGESWPSRRRHAPRGYASLCWPASVPATRSRVVWGRQGDWRSGSAPRSHRGGRWFEPSIAHQLRTWRKARSDDLPGRPHPTRGWGLPMPGQVSSSLRTSPRAGRLRRRRPSSTGRRAPGELAAVAGPVVERYGAHPRVGRAAGTRRF
jgi:hypothetical protein